jgi:hypothetical protein
MFLSTTLTIGTGIHFYQKRGDDNQSIYQHQKPNHNMERSMQIGTEVLQRLIEAIPYCMHTTHIPTTAHHTMQCARQNKTLTKRCNILATLHEITKTFHTCTQLNKSLTTPFRHETQHSPLIIHIQKEKTELLFLCTQCIIKNKQPLNEKLFCIHTFSS